MDKVIPAYWYRSGNYGDELTPFLIEKMTGSKPALVQPTEGIPHVCMIGSVLDNVGSDTIVWGAGFVNWGGQVPPAPKEVCAVRGSLSALKYSPLMEINDIALGDPALLLPIYHQPQVEKKYRLGIVPHVVDLLDVAMKYGACSPDVLVINLWDPVEKVIDQILSCETVISSSLHGLITAHAYGIPARWVEFSGKVLGQGFKFADYSTTVEFENTAWNLQNFPDIRAILDVPITPATITTDLPKLLSTCPFLN